MQEDIHLSYTIKKFTHNRVYAIFFTQKRSLHNIGGSLYRSYILYLIFEMVEVRKFDKTLNCEALVFF